MKKISIKFLEGGALLQISTGGETHGQMFVYPFCKYSQSEIKDEKFYAPASFEIFKNVGKEFTVLKHSYSDTQYDVVVREFQNGYYVTIFQGDEIVKEFITETSVVATYSILLRRLLEILFFSNNHTLYDENVGETLEFEIFG